MGLVLNLNHNAHIFKQSLAVTNTIDVAIKYLFRKSSQSIEALFIADLNTPVRDACNEASYKKIVNQHILFA